MTPEQKAAFIMAQAACAMAEIAGMQAENQCYFVQGAEAPYGYPEFKALIEKYGIHNNAVLTFFA